MLLCAAVNARAATYVVTNSAPQGPGSFIDAVANANGNPGLDTISITVDITRVTALRCGLLQVSEPSRFFMATVTDDLIIEGNGKTIQGGGFWVAPDGRSNQPGTVPQDVIGISITAEAPGFLRVETGNVTVKDLKLLELSAIAEVRQAGALTLERVTGDRIFDFFQRCERPAIFLDSGNNSIARTIKIKDSTFAECWNNGMVFPTHVSPAPWNNAFIYNGIDTNAVLEVSNSIFDSFVGIPAIEWAGTTKLQNSRVVQSGFIHTSGQATIVNSVFMATEANQRLTERIIASHGGSIVLEACSISAGVLDCDPICQGLTGDGLIIAQGGTIELKASAVGVTVPVIDRNLLIREAGGGNVIATAGPNPNWIQPVPDQDAAALRTILNLPALLTDAPGLTVTFQNQNYLYRGVTPLLGTVDAPGKLINAVTGANTTNVLLSPIDGTVITTDVFGNPRTGHGGTVRDIGAVQLNTGGEIFTVTNSAPRGPGSFIDAVAKANFNPGLDRIYITVDITPVTAGDCGILNVGDPSKFYMATVTDDLIIEGNGKALHGAGLWVRPDGVSNQAGTVPQNVPGISIIAEAPGFLRVETGNVTVRDLNLLKLSAIAEVRGGAGSLTLERVSRPLKNPCFSRAALAVLFFRPRWGA